MEFPTGDGHEKKKQLAYSQRTVSHWY